MNLIDLYDDNFMFDRQYHRDLARNRASDPCDDDWEALHMGGLSRLPEETEHEEPSPLRFR